MDHTVDRFHSCVLAIITFVKNQLRPFIRHTQIEKCSFVILELWLWVCVCRGPGGQWVGGWGWVWSLFASDHLVRICYLLSGLFIFQMRLTVFTSVLMPSVCPISFVHQSIKYEKAAIQQMEIMKETGKNRLWVCEREREKERKRERERVSERKRKREWDWKRVRLRERER